MKVFSNVVSQTDVHECNPSIPHVHTVCGLQQLVTCSTTVQATSLTAASVTAAIVVPSQHDQMESGRAFIKLCTNDCTAIGL